jgi:hypothetical protein
VRSGHLHFAVHADHVLPETDRVVATHGGWVTIASTGRNVNYSRACQQVMDSATANVEQHR